MVKTACSCNCKGSCVGSFNYLYQDFSLHFLHPSRSPWGGVFTPGKGVNVSFVGRCRLRGGRHTSCARPAFPSPGLAVLAWTAFLEPRRRRPGACPTAFFVDALLCGESPLPSLTMRTSVLGHHPQDGAAWWPGAYMCLRGEHRALLLMILEMQSKHLLSHMCLTTYLEVRLSLTGPVGEGRE